ncbi:MAG: hypothetical protein JRH20_31595 [Deltaproteobacteria bacterium]|nr:hypothetical protein [Deltaproteobacteria bacterium]
MFKSERRSQRSIFLGPSLELWLSSVATRNELAKMVLADSQGLLVAASDTANDAEALAAKAPLYIQREDETTIDRFHVDGEPVYLSMVGAGEKCADAISEARAGIHRIFSQRA